MVLGPRRQPLRHLLPVSDGLPPDLDGDGMVGILDLLALLTNRGLCA